MLEKGLVGLGNKLEAWQRRSGERVMDEDVLFALVQTEDVLFALVQTAKDQQETVQRALHSLGKQQAQLTSTIAELQHLQANVGAKASEGIKSVIANIGSDLDTPLTLETDKAKKVLRAMTEDLTGASTWLTWRWIAGFFVLGMMTGYTLCWWMCIRDLRNNTDRLAIVVKGGVKGNHWGGAIVGQE